MKVERYFPAEERHAALWLALAGPVIGRALDVDTLLSMGIEPPLLMRWGQLLWEFALGFLVAGVLVFVAVRVARAPRVLAAYAAAFALLATAAALGADMMFRLVVYGGDASLEVLELGLPPMQVGQIWHALGVSAGCIAGAWFAHVLGARPAEVLGRFRSAGLEGDSRDRESDLVDERPTPRRMRGLAFLGLEGGLHAVETRVAMWFLALAAFVGLISTLTQAPVQYAMFRQSAPLGSELALVNWAIIVNGATYYLSLGLFAFVAVRKMGAPRSLWLQQPGLYVRALIVAVVMSGSASPIERLESASTVVSLSLALATVGLVAVHLATRTRATPATMSAQEAGEAPGIDHTGGEHV
ncbi:MAG: hypothetical protein Q8K99_04850 [Actinomycetota bacterium]|nr:hypothetical protein [Actinomycetota bacterium]